MIKNLSMIGLSKLGAPLAACWSAKGFRVIAVDVDARKVEAIERGVSPILEPGVDKLPPLCGSYCERTFFWSDCILVGSTNFQALSLFARFRTFGKCICVIFSTTK
jgi:hypothetical protein